MNVIFISGVTLGAFAMQGLIASEAFQKGEVQVDAIFSLADEKAHQTSGYQTFDELAHRAHAPLHKITSIKTTATIERIKAYAPDLICIIGWSELAPAALLDIPKEKHHSPDRHGPGYGCIGMHPTLLPEGRGRAPIPWAIIKGLEKSGVTLFYLEERADAGDIIAQQDFAILPDDDAASVYEKAAKSHYELMRDNITLLSRNCAHRIPQDGNKITIWGRRYPEDGVIDWNKSQRELNNWIRALTHPYTGAFTFWNGRKLFVWKACLNDSPKGKASPGTIIDISEAGITIACIDEALTLQKLQMEGGPILDGERFADHYGLCVGTSFSIQFNKAEVIS